jgi:glycosyltransferase involved in cell wall biosynthesis
MDINILLPVLNEERSLEKGIKQILEYINNFSQDHNIILTIIDNGSTDKTKELSKEIIRNFSNVKYLRLEDKGVGLAFREGIKRNQCEIVGYMDIDLSTDLKHLNEMITSFTDDSNLEFVNASRFNKKSITTNRKWYRKITSLGLMSLLRLFFNMRSSDAICGFKFFRKNSVENLIKISNQNDNGWFYIIELLIRAEIINLKMNELPVVWKDDHDSKVKVFKLFKYYIKSIIRLRKELNEEYKVAKKII